MRFPRIPRRWRLRSLMVLVAVSAVGLFAYREYRERGPVYWEIARIWVGGASARANAAIHLGLLGPRASFATWVLNGVLDDPDPNVRAQAAYAMIRLGSRSPRLFPILVDQIERAPEPEPGFHPETPLFWPDGIPPPGWPLSDGGLPRNDPLQALMMIRPDAARIVPGLRKPLASSANHVRRAALGALLAVASWTTPPSPELAEELLAVVASDRPSSDRRNLEEPFDERKRAVDALARLDRPVRERAVAMLAADLRDLGTPRSYEAVALLTRLDGGTAAAVSALAEHVRDGDDARRSIALVLLHWIGEPAAPAAATILRVIEAQDNDREVPIGLLEMSWWVAVSRWVAAKPIVDGPAVEGRPSVIALGVKALRAMGKPVERAAIRELIAFVQDPKRPAEPKRGAIAALGDFGPSAVTAVPALIAGLEGKDVPTRVSIVTALGRFVPSHPEAVATLVTALDDPAEPIRIAAVHVLGEHVNTRRDAVLPALVKAAGDPSRSVACWACHCLGEVRPPAEILPTLIDRLERGETAVRAAAAGALWRIGEAANRDGEPEVAKRAVIVLTAALRDRAAEVRSAAASSLGRFGLDAASAEPALRAARNDPDRHVRDQAAEALQQITAAREWASSRQDAGAGDKPRARR